MLLTITSGFHCYSQVVSDVSESGPLLLFIKDVEKCTVGNLDLYPTFKSNLERLPDNVVVIGSQTQTDSHKEKVILFWLV